MKLKRHKTLYLLASLLVLLTSCGSDDEKSYNNIFGYIDGSSVTAATYLKTALGFSVTGNVLFTDYNVGDCVVARFTIDERMDGNHYIGRDIYCDKIAKSYLNDISSSSSTPGAPLRSFYVEMYYLDEYLADNFFVSVYTDPNSKKYYFPLFYYDSSIINSSFNAESDEVVIDVHMQETTTQMATAKSFTYSNHLLYVVSLGEIRNRFNALSTFSNKMIKIKFRYNTDSGFTSSEDTTGYLFIE